ncbi:ATP-binding protein [Streptomyces platensis]|uniref:ATP-binding protein n=1 Tax=Streptomyces platensis TaxID=58346 RepID=UPI002E13DC4B|nr:ATP-binding protein [Streptomyces platensis]
MRTPTRRTTGELARRRALADASAEPFPPSLISGTNITMTLVLNHGLLRLEVRDETARRPEIQQPADGAEHGRGLILVQAITEQCGGKWGTGPDGTSTWCTIPVPAEGDQ